jgi:diguanylate cyclase (GGDEF)-like protein
MTGDRRRGVLAPAVALLVTVVATVAGTGLVPVGTPALAYPSPSIPWFALAVCLVTVAQLALLWVRVGSGMVGLAWGECAIVVLCAMLPPAWIPLAVMLGVAAARGIRAIRGGGNTRKLRQSVWSVGVLTLAGTAAAVVATLVASPYGRPLTPATVTALTLGALAYALVGVGSVSRGLAAKHSEPFWPVVRRTVTSKLPMIVGNVAVGLLIVALAHSNPPWLALLPPALWLLHQAYAYRLRHDDERRNWQTFAEATRHLNSLDERGTASAGIHGALRLFGGGWAYLSVIGPDGNRRWYYGEPDIQVVECDPVATDEGTVRGLFVGGVRVGELRLGPNTAGRIRGHDDLMFAAYADALAAALHDASTHHELRAMTERSTRDLSHDSLTMLPNRTGFLHRGERVVRELPPDTDVGLLLFDIDHFKDVNDTLGHAAGDELLKIVATRLDLALRPGEMLARLGGDEFAVLVPGLAPLPDGDGESPTAAVAGAVARARSFARALAARIEVAGVQLSVEASVGVVVDAAGTVNLTELLRRADIAMYQAKRGGASVAWYDPARDRASTDRLSLLAELREALAGTDQLVLAMQPAVGLADGGATGVEALIRWQHPRRGTLLPADFVPVVENSELLGQFTRYVLDRALAIAAGWAAEGLSVPVAVNMSPRSLLDGNLAADVAALLHKHGTDPRLLILEITETVVMSELSVIDDVLGKLRELGVQLAVDDFGTGYSSLTFLTRVSVDEVKIDRSFVQAMVESTEVAAIVRTTIDLAHRLDLRVVAEGVETAEQRAALAELGCTSAQGFLFHPPMAPERVTAVLHELSTAKILKLHKDDVG